MQVGSLVKFKNLLTRLNGWDDDMLGIVIGETNNGECWLIQWSIDIPPSYERKAWLEVICK